MVHFGSGKTRPPRAGDGDYILGAAIGTGLVARAAERGGVDFLLALNVGRVRAQGLAPIASMLPLGNANDIVLEFAEREIAGQVSIPVFAGLSVYEPQHLQDQRLAELATGPIAGVVNFPTAVHYPPKVQATLEAAGMGLSAEFDLLERARTHGLQVMVYVKTEAEAAAASRIAPEMLCINFGWNAGGRLTELQAEVSVEEAIYRARAIARVLSRRAPDTRVLIEGGPVVHPSQVADICVEAGIAGYVGGSTLDRLPIEDAVYDRAMGFKAAGVGRRHDRSVAKGLRAEAEALGLWGSSPALAAALQRIDHLAQTRRPVLISGPPGTQRHAAVRLLRRRARVDGSDWGVVDASEQSDLELGMLLFGRGRDTPGMVEQHDGLPILIEPLDDLPKRWQRKLARLIDRGAVSRFRGSRPIPARPWFLFLSRQSLEVLERDRILVPELARTLQARDVLMPDIAAREGDLPELLAGLCRSHGSRVRFGPSAVSLLSRMSWPGQISDLRALIERLEAHNVSGEIGAADLDPFVSDRIAPPPVPKTLDADQKAWLLAVLRRHGFNRSAAARSLGISRKTLYNRLHRLGL